MTGKTAPQSGSSRDSTGNNKTRESLQGSIPSLATADEIRSALDRAFDYRGDVAITLRSGERYEGYVFDRTSNGPTLDECRVRMFPKEGGGKVSLRYSEITRLEFTGRDTAAGKSFDLWIRKYYERKARGEKGISLEPEPLD